MVLFRAVDIGAELFAMSARARARRRSRPAATRTPSTWRICSAARRRLRIAAHFDNLFGPTDAALFRVSQQVLQGEYEWLERGIVAMESEDAEAPDKAGELIGAAR